MKEYDEKTLKRVQKIELEILKDFKKLCDRHGLDYFGIAGTGIGVLRHGGFIPWDDDIDIALPRKDYEEFLRLAKKELADKYTILNVRENENYPLMTTRLVKKGTKFREYALKDINCDFGIFLDIYPFDNVSDDEKEYKKQGRKVWFYSKLLILRSIPFPVLGATGWKKKVLHAATAICHYILKISHISKKWIAKKCDESMRMYNDKQTSRLTYFADTTPYMNIFDRNAIFPLKEYKFEDVMIKMPYELDRHLTTMYGNYMELPPIEKRKNHYPYELDFGECE